MRLRRARKLGARGLENTRVRGCAAACARGRRMCCAPCEGHATGHTACVRPWRTVHTCGVRACGRAHACAVHPHTWAWVWVWVHACCRPGGVRSCAHALPSGRPDVCLCRDLSPSCGTRGCRHRTLVIGMCPLSWTLRPTCSRKCQTLSLCGRDFIVPKAPWWAGPGPDSAQLQKSSGHQRVCGGRFQGTDPSRGPCTGLGRLRVPGWAAARGL